MKLMTKDLLEALKDEKTETMDLSPKRCGRCDGLLTPRMDRGRIIYDCPNCYEETDTVR